MLLSFVFSLYLLLTGSVSPVVAGHDKAVAHDVAVAVADSQTPQERTDRLRGIEDERHRSEATLNSSRDLFRVSVSRPQRLLPVYGSKNSRTLIKNAQLIKSNLLNINKPTCNRQTYSAPLHGSASCEYYVFALRRILC